MKLLVKEPAVVIGESEDSLLIVSAADAENADPMALAQRFDKDNNELSEQAFPVAQWMKWLYYVEEVSPPRPFTLATVPT